MKIKTSELTGAALDWAVASIEAWEAPPIPTTCRDCQYLEERGISDGSDFTCIHPEASWLTWCIGGFYNDQPFGDGISVEYGVHQKCPRKTYKVPCPEYSTNWSQGGPIIEREVICLTHPKYDCWTAIGQDSADLEIPLWQEDGPTPLIAAMRCLVASKLGDEVYVPEELT